MQPPTNGHLEQIAELLNNVVDEIQNGASYVKVDQIFNAQDFSHALLFQDNGGGMDIQFEFLDTMAMSLPRKHVFPPVLEFSASNFQNADPKYREASVMSLGVISEGAYEE